MLGKNKSNPTSLISAINFLQISEKEERKKSLGQNFLIDKNILEKIVN